MRKRGGGRGREELLLEREGPQAAARGRDGAKVALLRGIPN